MNTIETEEKCRRLARAISADITLYNDEYLAQVANGLPAPQSLLEAIEDGRQLYHSRTNSMYAHLFEETLGEFLQTKNIFTIPTATSSASAVAPSMEVQTPIAETSHRPRQKSTGIPGWIILLIAIAAGLAIAYAVVYGQ